MDTGLVFANERTHGSGWSGTGAGRTIGAITNCLDRSIEKIEGIPQIDT